MQPDRGDNSGLDRLLGIPETAWLLARVRTRIAASGGARLTGVVQRDRPTDAERAAIVRLVGRPRRPGAALRVDLAEVEEILRRGPWPAGLADAVATLTGPVIDTAGERRRTATEWATVEQTLLREAAADPGLRDWWVRFCGTGGLKRATRAEAERVGATSGPDLGAELVAALVAVLAALPSAGEPLPVLARRITGEAHGLDMSRPLGRLSTAAVTASFAPDADSGRDAWAAAGVVLSTVASTVLCLGVPGAIAPVGAAAQATAAALEAMRQARLPVILTLDQVRSGGVEALAPGRRIHACENPTVIEVVAQRWQQSADARAGAPIVICTWGQPSTAVVELIATLIDRGADCGYHGDFDWPGLRIARALAQRIPWQPWRFAASDYLSALDGELPSGVLRGKPTDSPWDPGLAAAMVERGRAVEEEAVADTLARDLVPGPH